MSYILEVDRWEGTGGAMTLVWNGASVWSKMYDTEDEIESIVNLLEAVRAPVEVKY